MSCKSTALCLFDKQDVQMDIVSTTVTDYHPLNTIVPGSPIEFRILGTPEEYIDLGDLQIRLQLKILKKDKATWSATDKDVAFVNLPLASVFQDVFLTIGETQVKGGIMRISLRFYNFILPVSYTHLTLPTKRIV